MTTFILHGGATSKDTTSNDAFFEEMIKGEEPVRILLVYFTRPKEEWEDCLRQDTERFFFVSFQKELEIEIAKEVKENFIQQIKESDVIYMRGGKEMKLQEMLESIKNVGSLFEGKVVAGSSMGAYVLYRCYYRNEERKLREGLGILPIKIFCHYDETKKDILDEFQDFKENLPAYTLKEGEYIIVDSQGEKI